jgi:hypothetical protein
VPSRLKSNHVFINCPFDAGYRPILNAILFAVFDLGFVARCALEEEDTGEFRLSKIERIIEECRYGVNDLSAVAPDVATGLPRFNMPLELASFSAASALARRTRARSALSSSTTIHSDIASSSRTFPARILARTAETRSVPFARCGIGCRQPRNVRDSPAAVKSLNDIGAFRMNFDRSVQKSDLSPIA